MEQQSTNNDPFLPVDLETKYQVIETLGNGAFGEVRKVICESSRRHVAMKKILKRSPTYDTNTQREILILMSISHPFIVKFVAMEISKDAFFIVMECANKGNLDDYVQNCASMTEEHTKYLFSQITIAVEYLHDSRIMHRDLKPANILLHQNSHNTLSVKVSDFGISKLSIKTGHHTFIGTPQYMAPEVRNFQKYSYKADVWSLGVILYFMLAKGDIPFEEVMANKTPNAKNATKQANDLLRKMLTNKYEERIDSKNITEHSWISEDSEVRKKIAVAVLTRFLERILENRRR